MSAKTWNELSIFKIVNLGLQKYIDMFYIDPCVGRTVTVRAPVTQPWPATLWLAVWPVVTWATRGWRWAGGGGSMTWRISLSGSISSSSGWSGYSHQEKVFFLERTSEWDCFLEVNATILPDDDTPPSQWEVSHRLAGRGRSQHQGPGWQPAGLQAGCYLGLQL